MADIYQSFLVLGDKIGVELFSRSLISYVNIILA